MKLDLHCHTEHSFDCKLSINDLIVSAEKAELDAIAICDHDSMTAVARAEKISKNLSIIPGCEITAKGGAHILGLFLEKEIRSRNILDIINDIHAQNGLAVIAHPFRPGTGLIYLKEKEGTYDSDTVRKAIGNTDLIEAVNGRNKIDETVDTERFFNFYPDKPHSAGSDAHSIEELGRTALIFDDFNTDNLDDIKRNLITAERQIRYCAFNYEPSEKRTLEIKTGDRSLVIKSEFGIAQKIAESLNILYKKFGFKNIKEKSEKTDETKRK